jgi:glycosyltransferase involved in cell wall biosynthesis
LAIICRMPVHVLHVLDQVASEDGVRLLSLLLRRMPASEVRQSVLAMGHLPRGLEVPGTCALKRIGRRFNWAPACVPDVQRVMRGIMPDAVLTWSASAAVAGRLAWRPGAPIAAVVCEPGEASRSANWWRSLEAWLGPVDFLCTSGIVRRRLIERGVPAESAVVIRPGVDFGRLREARGAASRARLGLPERGLVLVTPSPPSREAGQFQAIWAMAVVHQIFPDARLIVPGTSREQRRLRRLVGRIYCPEVYRLTEDRHAPEELLAVSDMLLVPAVGDVPVGWLAMAMAGGVPILGAAIPSIAELIADRENGLLCRPGDPHELATRLRLALDSPDLLRDCASRARGQAYDVFRAERCVDEYLVVIRNLASGTRATAGVTDAAIA